MNFAEKLAGLYLRLNGFLALSQFTVFEGQQHNHIDIVALRACNSQETVGEAPLLTDDKLFDALSIVVGSPAHAVPLGVAAEVRTNNMRDTPSDAQIQYVSRFLGGLPVSRLAFFEGAHTIQREGDTLDIGLRYAGLWIQRRIDWMLNSDHGMRLTKIGSWNWSEGFLSDFIALRRCGLMGSDREG